MVDFMLTLEVEYLQRVSLELWNKRPPTLILKQNISHYIYDKLIIDQGFQS